MAIADLPDELHEYVPTLEDEGTNADAPVDPMLAPDDDPNVLELDEPEAIGVSVEDAVIEDPEGFDAGFGLIESRESDLPVYAQGDAAALALEIDPAIESTLDDDGDIYSLTDGSPSDVAWAAAVDLAPALGTVDEPEFDDEPISLPEEEEAAEQIVPIQYEIQGRSLTAEWHTLATVAADKTSAEVAGLPTEDNWSFRVRAIYPNGLTGDWSAETDVNLPTDLLAPPVPSAPTLTAGRGVITVHWDGKGANGEAQPADYQHTAVWVSTSGEVGTWTIAGLLFADGGSLPYTFAGYNTPYYFSLSSRDLVGNESARSATADTKLRPLVEEPDIEAELDRIDKEYDGVITEARQLGERLRDAEEEQVLHGEIIDELENVELPGLKQRLADAEAEIADQNTELNTRLGAAEVELTAHAQRLVDNEAELDLAQADIDEAMSGVTELRDAELPALNARLQATQAELDQSQLELGNRLNGAESELTAHGKRLTTSEASLAAAQGEVSKALIDITDLRDVHLPALGLRLGSAETELASTQADLDTLSETVIPALESGISGTQTRLGVAESEITGAKARITEAESDLTDAFKRIDLVADDTAAAQKSANEAKQDAINKSEAARVAAVAEAEATATAKAAAAVSDATTAAAADAKTKADAARVAAIAAAKTATDLAASGAKKEAIDAAKADAKTKADAAQAAAIAAAASDATAKANKAKADATTAAANDATAKANNAKAAAIAAASSDATAKANTAKTEAVAAATVMTNGIGKNLSSTAAPTTSNAAPNGSVWRRTDSSGRVIGSWEQTGAGIASTWTPRLIRSEVIDNVDIGKLSASSATINTAVVNKMAAQVATVIELNADRITAGAIKASQIDASSLAVAIASVIRLNASSITAGTISVDRLNVSSLAASIANVISLNASKITAGTISAARLDVNDLAVRIANVIELNASKINAGTINTSRLDTAAIAAATASIQKADIKNLTASNGTFSAAVIEKLWADVITARKIVADQILIGSGTNMIPWKLQGPGKGVDNVSRYLGSGAEPVWGGTDSVTPGAGHLIMNANWVAPGASTLTWRILLDPSVGALGNSGFPVEPGQEYRASAYLKAGGTYTNGTPDAQVSLFWYDGEGKYVAAHQSPAELLKFSWVKHEVSAKAPATAAYAQIYLRQNQPGNVRLDMPSLQLKSDGSLIVSGSISGDHLEVNTVSAAVAKVIKLSASSITSGTVNTSRLDTAAIAAKTAAIQKADIKNLTVSSGTFSAAVIEKLWADVITARKIYANQLMVGSGSNLIVDPYFTDSKLRATRATEANEASTDGWYWTGTYWYSKVNPGSGTHVFRLRNTDSGSVYDDLTIEPGAKYRFKWDGYSTGGGTTRIALRVKKLDGATRYAGATIATQATTGWKTYTGEWTPDEDDISFCTEIQWLGTVNPSRLAFRNPSVVSMVDGSLIVNGSVDAKAINSSSVSAEVAKFINLNVSRLVATTANLSSAVINKLWTDVVHSRKITAEMLAVGSFDNVIPNPNFEDSGAGWTGSGTYGGSGDLRYMEQPATAVQRGQYSQAMPGRPGDEYRISADIMLPDASLLTALNLGSEQVSIYARSVSSSGAETTYAVNTSSVTASSSTRGTLTGTWKAPAGTAKIRFGFYVQSRYANRVRFYSPQASRMAGGELIVDGAITAAKIKAKSITAAELAANSVTADKVDAGAIDGQVITGATMRTNSAGTGVIINKSGIEAKTSAGRQFFLSATTGMMSARGDITTGADNTYRAKLSNRGGMAALDLYSAGGNAAHHGALISWSDQVALRRYTNETKYDSELAMTAKFTRLQHAGGGSNVSLEGGVAHLSNGGDSQVRIDYTGTRVRYGADSELFLTGGTARLSTTLGSNILQSVLYNGAYHTIMAQVEKTTTTGGANINVNAGYIRKVTSASKYKLFPKAFDESLDDKLLSIDAKHWLDKHEAEETSQLMCPETLDVATDPSLDPDQAATNPMRRVPGVIAEEVRDAGLDEFVVYDSNGEVEGVMYDRLGVALIPVVKRQRDRLTAQADRIDELEAKLAALADKVDALLAA